MEILPAALILVAAISIGFSCVFIARNRGSINKHSRQRIKDYENDIKYLSQTNREDAKEYRHEILRLKGSINKMKQGPDLTEQELESGSIGEVLIKKFGLGKYLKYLPKGTLEKIESGIMENKDEIIDKLKANSKQAQPQPEAQTTGSL